MVADGSSLWLADANAGTVVRADRRSGAVAQTLTVGGTPGAMAVGDGSIWVADAPGTTVTRKTNSPVSSSIRNNVPASQFSRLTALSRIF